VGRTVGQLDLFARDPPAIEQRPSAGTVRTAARGPHPTAAGYGGVEQLVARLAHNQEVAGPNPAPANLKRSIKRTDQSMITVTKIMDEMGLKRHQVNYAIKILGIKPMERAGFNRVYDPSILDILSAEFENRRLRYNLHNPTKPKPSARPAL
jgi:hypothetical protein